MKFAPTVLVFLFLTCSSLSPVDYTGDRLLTGLGLNANSTTFRAVKEFWLLDKDNQNANKGIKFITDANGVVQSIFIAGGDIQINGVNFHKHISPLPLGILLSDDVASLNKKLGNGVNISGRNAIKYLVKGTNIEVAFTGTSGSKISGIRFYTESKTTASATNAKSGNSKPTSASSNTVVSPFKAALLSVFSSYRESSFYNIKNANRTSGNFWNYQYTYSTRIKIPGEKFNMLYSFPFPTSALDFVSVLKEADAYDASFQTMYKDFEKKLMQNFPPSDGWVASCIANPESKTLSDLQFSNDKYGSIILDYSKNPRGKHILYLRFLLYS